MVLWSFGGSRGLKMQVCPSQQRKAFHLALLLSTGQSELRTPNNLSTAASARPLKGHLPQTEPVGAASLSPQGIFPGSSSKPYAQHTQCTSTRSEPQLWGHHSRAAPDWRPPHTNTCSYTHIHTSQRVPHSQQGQELLRVTFSSPPAGWNPRSSHKHKLRDSCFLERDRVKSGLLPEAIMEGVPLLEKNILPARVGITSTRDGCFQQSLCLGRFSSSGPASRKPASGLQESRRLRFPGFWWSRGERPVRFLRTCPCSQQPWVIIGTWRKAGWEEDRVGCSLSHNWILSHFLLILMTTREIWIVFP